MPVSTAIATKRRVNYENEVWVDNDLEGDLFFKKK
jgi:hypothetical protein